MGSGRPGVATPPGVALLAALLVVLLVGDTQGLGSAEPALNFALELLEPRVEPRVRPNVCQSGRGGPWLLHELG